ncbi:MAG: histidinol-phosphate transaminase [Acidithiobacillus sp.]|nr:histidinol-phosphate transaminase [Acidithiobacillus sp.]
MAQWQPLQWIAELTPYQPGKPLAELERELGITAAIKLASNENPLGPGPKAQAAIKAALEDLALYPEGTAPRLRQALARQHGLEPEQIILGNGSDEIIHMLVRAFAGPGRTVVVSQYAFASYAIAARAVGASVQVVPAQHYGHDLAAMAAAVDEQTVLLFLANPNNPTGTSFDNQALVRLLEQVPKSVIVVLDEAYAELMPVEEDYPRGPSYLGQHANLLVLRTFSKAYALAALRCGYGMAGAELIAVLERLRQPFNVNSLAQEAALAALFDDEHLQATIENNNKGLQRLQQGLQELGLTTLPAAGNFITFLVPGRGAEVYDALLRKGVIIRPLRAYGLPDHLRVSVGLPEQNERFLQSLGEVL